MAEVLCFSCGKKTLFDGVLGRREECSQCRSDLHVCKNCSHYDAKSYNECKEPVAEVVREKDRANYCDHFVPGSGSQGNSKSKEALLAAAQALFKK